MSTAREILEEAYSYLFPPERKTTRWMKQTFFAKRKYAKNNIPQRACSVGALTISAVMKQRETFPGEGENDFYNNIEELAKKDPGYIKAKKFLNKALPEKYQVRGGNSVDTYTIAAFNDDKKTKKEDVKEVWTRAIKFAIEEEEKQELDVK
jgi:hypothetical protein